MRCSPSPSSWSYAAVAPEYRVLSGEWRHMVCSMDAMIELKSPARPEETFFDKVAIYVVNTGEYASSLISYNGG